MLLLFGHSQCGLYEPLCYLKKHNTSKRVKVVELKFKVIDISESHVDETHKTKMGPYGFHMTG